MCDGFEVRAASGERQSLAAFFSEEDGEGIIDMLEVGPLMYPLISVGGFWEFARKAKAIDLLCRKLGSDRSCGRGIQRTKNLPDDIAIA